MPMDEAFDAYNAERLRAAGTLLAGATTCLGFRGFWPPMADDPDARPVLREIGRLENAIDKVVVSDTITEDQTDPWRSTTRIVRRADAHRRVAELKQEPGGEILFGTRPPRRLRLAGSRRFDGSDNLILRYEVGRGTG